MLDSVIKDRAIRLFTFLRELSELRTKTIRSFEAYEQVVWLSDIPLEKGCHVYIWADTLGTINDSWIEVCKPKLLPPPPIPESIKPWVIPKELFDSSVDAPRLTSTRVIEEDVSEPDNQGEVVRETTVVALDDYPEIKNLWESYLDSKWIPWAKTDLIQKQIQKAYSELYAMYQYQQRMGESYEVVLGLGFLTWKTPSGQLVKRHLITAQTQFTFDPDAGRISVVPSAEGSNITLEQDMLEPEERPDSAEINLIESLIEELDEDITNQDAIDSILRSWINSLPNSIGYEQDLSPNRNIDSFPKVVLAPALILRRRTERSLVRAFKEIIEQIKKAEQLPSGLDNLVKDPDKEETGIGVSLSESDNPYPGSTSIGQQGESEILFPLPANDEQIEIARQLKTQRGVLVQGPPGTGKSHTIANLICHLLATGKRVLVTSHTSRALVVLREKIPQEIAPLCVIALSDDAKSLKALEGSVNGITEKHNSWNPIQNEREVKRLQQDLDIARREEAKALADLRAIREAETYKYNAKFGTYSGTLKTIAGQIREDEHRYSWLVIPPNNECEPPLNNLEAIELLNVLRQLSDEQENEIEQYIPATSELPNANEFASLVKAEQSAKEKFAAYDDAKDLKEYDILAKCDASSRTRLQAVLNNLISKIEHLSDEAFHWAKEAVHQVLANQHLPLIELHELSKQHLDGISSTILSSGEVQISGIENYDRKTVEFHARALLSHLENNGSLGWWKFRPRVVSDGLYLIERIRVNGVLCSTIDTLQTLLEWITLNDHFESLNKAWTSYHSLSSSNVYRVQKAEFESRVSCLSRCLSLEDDLKEAKEAICHAGLAEPVWHNIDRIKKLNKVLTAIDIRQQLRERSSKIDKIAASLDEEMASKANVHPLFRELIVAVNSRNTNEYGKLLQRLCELDDLRVKFERKRLLLSLLAEHAPILAESLTSNPEAEQWDERVNSFTSAWNWAIADGWIKRLSNPSEQQHLNHQVRQLRERIQILLAELAATNAWRHCLARLTDYESGHLRAWQLAVRRIGRGTGVRVNEYRRDARRNLEECRSAIPAWIMPIYRVAETIEMKSDIFDVVIVDEASQSGPEALFLQYIAKKIVVVGDSKQISPQFVGMNKEDVALLRQRLIHDIPFNDALGIEHSFFDQAFIRYKGQICLREHFRCMPEIIQFSNNLCYNTTPLIPLKQFGAGRLTPTVGTRHITDGYQKGRSPRVINPPEAEAIAEFICNSCVDKDYDGKTIGVISLLGETQGKLIYSLLLEKIGPVEIEKRQLICGDAYAFQGDERDVIVLSMVSAPGDDHRIGTLTSPDAEKRFNVAASRAKEQLWLFHSATLDDLNPECLRYRLLKYCQNPEIEPIGIPGHDIISLGSLARTTRRDIVRPPIPFDSWFEVDVFLNIAIRGYRVIPQLDVAGYKIDLVVEGMRGRLAVECDGDEWHGPEQYERDMARQRQLERSGYSFWRVRGSTYYRDPVSAMESLWDTLSQMRILPGAGDGLLSDENNEPVENLSIDTENINAGTTTKMPDDDSENIETIEENDISVEIEGEELSEKTSERDNIQIGAEYKRWVPKPLPDPRTASLSQIADGLIDIIRLEGPVICHRVYSIYVNACGIQRVGKQLRSVFNKSINKAIRDGLIKQMNEHNVTDQIHKIVRIPECPSVVVRTRGDRTLEEIPPQELAAIMQELINLYPELKNDNERLFRKVLDNYGLVRMTTNTRGVLQKAFTLLGDR